MKLIICRHCGIKIEDKYNICPVCDTNQITGEKRIDKMEENIINFGWKKLTLNITFFMMLIPASLSLVTDYASNEFFSWSIIVIFSLIMAWTYLFSILRLNKNLIVLCLVIMLQTTILLFGLNYLQGENWFYVFGLPLSIGIPLISYIALLLIKRNINAPLRVLAIFMLMGTVICLFVDMLYEYLTLGSLLPTWSFIVLGAVLPLTLILNYLSRHKKVLNKWIHF